MTTLELPETPLMMLLLQPRKQLAKPGNLIGLLHKFGSTLHAYFVIFRHLESVVFDANQDNTTEELPQIPLTMLLLQPATSNTVGSITKQLYWITSK